MKLDAPFTSTLYLFSRFASAAATVRFTVMKLSGVSEIESMPHSTRKAAKPG